MSSLIRRKLPVLFFVLGGIFAFSALAFMALPVYPMVLFERVEAVHYDTQFTESNGNSIFVYDIPLQLYHFTPKGGTEKNVGVHSTDHPKAITIYFRRSPSSDAEYNVSDDNWRSGGEVMMLLIIGLVLLVPAVLAVVTAIVIRFVLLP